MILNCSNSSDAADDASRLPSFGQRQTMIAKLNTLADIEWNDLQLGHMDSQDYFGNIDLGENDIMPGSFWLGIYGGANPLRFVLAICKEYNCIAFDTVASQYITINQPSDKGWKDFEGFRKSIFENTRKNNKD